MLEKSVKRYLKEIKGIAQVGANTGQEVETFLKYGIKKISLFEPLPSAFKELSVYKKFDNVKMYNLALGNKNEETEIYVADKNSGASSSILKPTLHNELFPEIQFNKKEKIIIKKFSSLNITGHNFLVMDTQGYELKVLEGFENKIHEFDFIYSEVSRKSIYEDDVLIKELDNFLKKVNFLRVATKWASNKPQGDALYIKFSRLNYFLRIYYTFKSKFQVSNFYYFINFFHDPKKVIYIFKQIIKKFYVALCKVLVL